MAPAAYSRLPLHDVPLKYKLILIWLERGLLGFPRGVENAPGPQEKAESLRIHEILPAEKQPAGTSFSPSTRGGRASDPNTNGSPSAASDAVTARHPRGRVTRYALPRPVLRDLRMLIRFIEIYCTAHHRTADKTPVRLKHLDPDAIAGRLVRLCPRCARLCMHALTKRTACPLNPKPSCKHCPQHCYHPTYRAQIREVMRFAGPRIILRGRLDLLVHLLF